MEILPGLAADGSVAAGTDIRQGGIGGTAFMLAECSGVGIRIDPVRITPPDTNLNRWITAFRSFGFLPTPKPENAAAVLARFHAREIGADLIGCVVQGSALTLSDGKDDHRIGDHAAAPYLGLTRQECPAHA